VDGARGTLLSGPDFGPGGYLPERAAKRSRKIVLREQMGLGWVLAAAAAALLVLLAGAVFLLTRTGPPAGPYRAVTPLADIDAGGAVVVAVDPLPRGLLVVRAGGPVRTFVAPPGGAAYCPASGLLEAPSGRSVWNLAGRRVGGIGESLRRVPSVVYDGVVYADPSTPQPAAAPDDVGAVAECALSSSIGGRCATAPTES
jgi:hypothetical protein